MTNASQSSRTCPWCAAVATSEARSCASCGAVLAQRETLGDVAIPGVTAVHPSLLAADGRPKHLAGPSASHGVANGVMVAAMIGGPVGLVALGGIAAVAAVEYAGARRDGIGGGPEDLASIGRPSELALLALERVEADSSGDSTPASTASRPAADPWRDLPGAAAPGAGAALAADPWGDLPGAAAPVPAPGDDAR